MKITELRSQSKDELKNTLNERLKKLGELRFQSHGGTLKNVKEIGKIRKDVARIKTVLNENK